MKPWHESMIRMLAGNDYGKLLDTQENTLAFLRHGSERTRRAAISACVHYWKCHTSHEFLRVCRGLAEADPSDSVRAYAIDAIGRAFDSSRDPEISRFLADICEAGGTPAVIREATYWALRRVQLGRSPEEMVKCFASASRGGGNEAAGLFSKLIDSPVDWDSADKIDQQFVRRFATRRPT